MRILALLLALAVSSLSAGEIEEIEESRAFYTYVIAAVVKSGSDPSPPPPGPSQVSEDCENCGGDGVLGDGRTKITCPECDGTGKRKRQAAISNGWPPKNVTLAPRPKISGQVKPTLVMFSTDNCVYCDRWLKLVWPQLQNDMRLRRVKLDALPSGWKVPAFASPAGRMLFGSQQAGAIRGLMGRSDRR